MYNGPLGKCLDPPPSALEQSRLELHADLTRLTPHVGDASGEETGCVRAFRLTSRKLVWSVCVWNVGLLARFRIGVLLPFFSPIGKITR